MKQHAIRGFAAALVLALAQGPALAQEESGGDYARLWRIDYMQGQWSEFIEAFDAHVEWRRDNGETWTWMAFRPVTGDRLNSIFVRSGDHTLAEMDEYEAFQAKASEHWNGSVDQYVESYVTWITENDEELGSWPEEEPNLIQAYSYRLKPGGEPAFNAALRKIDEGLVKVNWGEPYAIARVLSGSDGNEVWLILPYESYADMAEPDKTFAEALSEAWGEKEAGKLMKQISGAYESVDEILVRFDPEHSLILEE